jgi:hypothetical protein
VVEYWSIGVLEYWSIGGVVSSPTLPLPASVPISFFRDLCAMLSPQPREATRRHPRRSASPRAIVLEATLDVLAPVGGRGTKAASPTTAIRSCLIRDTTRSRIGWANGFFGGFSINRGTGGGTSTFRAHCFGGIATRAEGIEVRLGRPIDYL